MKKHAYLVMAHNDFDILKKTVEILDDREADFYIHIDKKTSDFKEDEIKNLAKSSKVFFVQRQDIQWGSDSMVKCELSLIRTAVKEGYEYYHLISGVDLPLKTPYEINEFFDKKNGMNFLSFSHDVTDETFSKRIKYYRLFQQKIGRNTGFRIGLYEKLENSLLDMQKRLKVDRMKSFNGEFQKGGNWFSITHELAQYILSCQKTIKKYFYYSECADEIFVQTIAMNSPLKDTIVCDALRYTDWTRGNPYTFREEDFENLINSGNMFARKFSTGTDPNVIDKIYSYLMNKKLQSHN